MRILDLGCGSGRDLHDWGVMPEDEVTGIDLEGTRLAAAERRFPDRTYLQAAGEQLPFPDEYFDRVIASVSMPYMRIPRVLSEIHRVLVSGGGLSASLHLPSFTVGELLHLSIPKPIPRCSDYTS